MYFGNTVKFPPAVNRDTEYAGEKSLSAASDIYKLISRLEISKDLDVGLIDLITDQLNEAINTYRRLVNNGVFIQDVYFPTKVEIEDSGITDEELDFFFSLPVVYPRSSARFRRNSYIPLGELYIELISFLEKLLNQTKALKNSKIPEASTLRTPIFQIMNLWEKLSRLARLIAIINSRVDQ